MQGLRKILGVGLVLVLLPTVVAGYQLAQVADAKGCPAHLTPSPGPLKIRMFAENVAQAAALQPKAFATYLADRTGRAVQIMAVEQADQTGFRLAAAARPVTSEMMVFLAYQPTFPNVPTAHGMVDALGFATPGTACAYVSFLPAANPTLCRLGANLLPVHPGYAYAAHELGHLLGLRHTPTGLMGGGVFDLCGEDTFSGEQRAAIQRWGKA